MMHNCGVRISVCLASYNGERYIKEQLSSIIKQIGGNDEIIIADDGSTDNTLEIINSLADPRIKIIKNNYNNHVRNFESALAASKGRYIFLCDQDDVWVNTKIEVCLKILRKYDLAVSDCYYTDANLNIKKNGAFSPKFISKVNSPFWRFKFLLFGSPYLGCCMAMNSFVRDTALPFPKDIEAHDRWIGYIARMVGRVRYTPQKLIFFRRHGQNQSIINSADMTLTHKSPYSLITKIYRRVLLYKNLIVRFWNIH